VTKKGEKKIIFLLRPFIYDPARTDPHKIALQDYQDEYFVEEILSHTGDWKRKSHMKFTVKWVGFDDVTPEQTWSDLRLNEKFHEYLTKNNRSYLIPKA
jgi:hypothetical protein